MEEKSLSCNENNKKGLIFQTTKSSSILSVNKEIICIELYRNNKYEDKGIVIRKWENEDSNYLASISLNDMKYLGVVNKKFERNMHGFLLYTNGELYFGDYKGNLRHKNGVYYWEPKLINNDLYETHMYIGSWENDLMKGQGLYLSIQESLNRRDYDQSEIEAYNGIINAHMIQRGTHLLKQNSNYYLYHGNFDSNGNKEDNNAYYYISNSDILIRGHIVNNHFITGFVAYFNSKGQIINLGYCTFNEKDNTIKNVKDQSCLNLSLIREVKKEFVLFRSVILQLDYFSNMYNKYKDTKDFIDQNMNSLAIFEDKERFTLLVQSYTDYHLCNIYRDIETKVFGRLENVK